MPRPRKCRKVCRMPKCREFQSAHRAGEYVVLTVDEYECIRLMDKEGFSQEQCARFMQVARTTAQQIYHAARYKLALALVEGMGIRIEGGDYALCDGQEQQCNCGGCSRHQKNV